MAIAPQSVHDCIVLGAGIAGVTAARNLQLQGMKVLLLEGSDRIGGRMYSVRDFVKKSGAPVPVEAGAEYIHVEEQPRYQEFWDEIKSHGFTTSQLHKCGVGYLQIPRNRMAFRSWKRTRVLVEVIALPSFWDVPHALEDLQKFDPHHQADVTARTFIDRFAKSTDLSGPGRQMLEYTLSAHTPGGLDELSIAGMASDRIPDQLMEMSEFRLELDKPSPNHLPGYDSVPQAIAEQFRKAGGKLLLSQAGQTDCKVVKVEREAGGLLRVDTQGGQSYRGRSAICSFSVGMLDPVGGEGDGIFGSLLTAEKRQALEVVRMGAITKFSLEFKERIWVDDGGYSSGHMSVLSHPDGKARTFFSSFPKEHQGPHVLTGLLMNQDHSRIANMNDGQAVQHLFEALKLIYNPKRNWKQEDVLAGRKTRQGGFVPNFLRQDWSKDPFAKGGNSYLRFFSKRQRKMAATQAREALKNPRETLPLFWAGEATAPAYDGNYQPLAVHGAYISGVRAAADVTAYLNDHGADAARFGRYYKGKYPAAA